MRCTPTSILAVLAIIIGRNESGKRSAVKSAIAGNTTGAVRVLPVAEYTVNVDIDTCAGGVTDLDERARPG
jgi:hypothetical protein